MPRTSRPATPPWFDDHGQMPPTAARIADHLLGGFLNTQPDRDLADQLTTAWPALREHVHGRRDLLGRMVTYLLGAGVRQFLDIGSGFAAHGPVHAIAADAGRAVRVGYVDLDPVVVACNRDHLHHHRNTRAVHGDLRDPATILNHPDLNQLLDYAQPIAVILFGVLDHLPPRPRPVDLLAHVVDALAPGSYLALAQLSPPRTAAQQLTGLYQHTPTPLHRRAPGALTTLLRRPPRLQLVTPGIVPAHAWHPDPDDPPAPTPALHAALARVEPQPRPGHHYP